MSDDVEDIQEFVVIDHFGFMAAYFLRNLALREHPWAPLDLAAVIARGGMGNRPPDQREICRPDNGGASVTALEICEFPDSGKLNAITRTGADYFRHIARHGESLDYWDCQA